MRSPLLRILCVYLPFLLPILFASCFERNVATNTAAPKAINLSLDSDEVVTVDTLEVTWEGSYVNCEFRWRIVGADTVWSEWSSSGALRTLIADGSYSLQINTRFPGLDDTTIATIPFTVVTIDTSSLFLIPREVRLFSSTQSVSLVVTAGLLDSCNVVDLGISGARITHAAAGASCLQAITLFTDSTVSIAVPPTATMFFGSSVFCTLTVEPIDEEWSDSSEVSCSVTSALYVRAAGAVPVSLGDAPKALFHF